MSIFLSLLPSVLIAILGFVFFFLIPRCRMERRARALLAQYSNAEQTSLYLKLNSWWAPGKQREIDSKIAEMKTHGWIFLRMCEANPLRTIRSLGGGVTLWFIRPSD